MESANKAQQANPTPATATPSTNQNARARSSPSLSPSTPASESLWAEPAPVPSYMFDESTVSLVSSATTPLPKNQHESKVQLTTPSPNTSGKSLWAHPAPVPSYLYDESPPLYPNQHSATKPAIINWMAPAQPLSDPDPQTPLTPPTEPDRRPIWKRYGKRRTPKRRAPKPLIGFSSPLPPLLPSLITPIPTSLITLNLYPVPLLPNYNPLFVSLLL